MVDHILQWVIGLWAVITALYGFRSVYFAIGLLTTRRFPKTDRFHIALFIRVDWKPIPHEAAIGIDQMN